MEKEKNNKLNELFKELGYTPKENRAIIVTFGAKNLSGKVAAFFTPQFYLLQICENEIVFLPIEFFTSKVKDQVHLEIPIDTIKNVTIEEVLFNYNIDIETETDIIELSTQQKELSGIRSSGILASSTKSILGNENWHKENFDDTLEELKNINK